MDAEWIKIKRHCFHGHKYTFDAGSWHVEWEGVEDERTSSTSLMTDNIDILSRYEEDCFEEELARGTAM